MAHDYIGVMALTWAAGKRHMEVVRVLLEQEDVNRSQPDTKYSRAPLSWAAEGGHEGVVKMLLEREDINPGQPDTKYHRALGS